MGMQHSHQNNLSMFHRNFEVILVMYIGNDRQGNSEALQG